MTEQPTTTDSEITALAEQLRTGFAAVTAAYVEALRQITTAMRPLLEYTEQHPEVLEQWRREREARAGLLGSCHCLCGTHQDTAPGVCTSVAEPDLTIAYDSPVVGTQHVAHCRPCYDAKTTRPRPGAQQRD